MARTAGGVERVALQILTLVLGLVAVSSGISGAVLGPRDAAPPVTFELDSNFRFLSVFLLGAGMVLFWCVPRLPTAAAPFRVVCGMVFLGGCARLLSIAAVGAPTATYAAFIGAELVMPPIMVALQSRLRPVQPATKV